MVEMLREKLAWIQGLSLLLVGGLIFFYKLGYPSQLIFDETYHIPAAQKYLNGVTFQENHPPLGKLLIALGERMFKLNPSNDQFIEVEKVQASIPEINFFGYRFFSALSGLFTVIILWLILRNLLKSELLAYTLAMLVMVDNAFLIQARAAVLDGSLIFFIVLAIWMYLKTRREEKKKRWWVGMAIAMAMAVGTKATGAIVFWLMVPLIKNCLEKIGLKRTVKRMGLFLGVLFFVYGGIWKVHFELTNQRKPLINLPQQVMKEWRYSANYNKGVPVLDLCKIDEVGSPWYMWLVGKRAISYRWETKDGVNYQFIYLKPNTVVWMASLVGVLVGLSLMVSNWWTKKEETGQDKGLRQIKIFGAMYGLYLVPFIFVIKRVMYLYHYLPAMILGLILLGLVLEKFEGVHKKNRIRNGIGLLILGLATINFLFLLPLGYYQAINKEHFLKISWGNPEMKFPK